MEAKIPEENWRIYPFKGAEELREFYHYSL
jgi:hypothetical protein